MDQTHGLKIRVRGQLLAVDYLWIGTGVPLAAVSGWYLPDFLLSESSAWQQILTAILLPLFLCTAVATLELGRTMIPGTPQLPFSRRLLGPLGSIATGYVLPETPGDEFRHEIWSLPGAVVTSTAAISLAWLAPAESTIRLILFSLAGSHLLLLVVNLMPAFPFAGGAVFRSIFWHLHGEHVSGTRAAFLYGQFIAAASVGFGLYFLTWRTEMIIPGLWGLYLGWMVIRASRNELHRAHVISRAADVSAADAIEGLNPTIRAAAPLTEAIDILMEQKSNGPGLVRDRVEYAGMITLEQIRQIPRTQWETLSTADATIPFETLHEAEPGAKLLEIFRTLSENEMTTVIVRRENGRIIGLIDHSIDPRLLVRRGIMRNIGSPTGERSPHGGPKTS